MKGIRSYYNGNVFTIIDLDTGTKQHFTKDDEFNYDFAECCDVNISNRCNNGCLECSYGCTPTGAFGELCDWKFLDTMHPYTEIAINIQDPLPPNLLPFLTKMKNKKVIVNCTVNQNHFMREDFQMLFEYLIENELINGIGISLMDPTQEGFVDTVKKYPTAVIHVIAGYTHPEDIGFLMGDGLKILILGYKTKGRGFDYFLDNAETILENIKWLASSIDEIFDGFDTVSFDNLAIRQLDLESKIPPNEWEVIYCGEDGTNTFFIDLVTGTFAVSSISDTHYDIGNLSIDEMFKVIRSEDETGN